MEKLRLPITTLCMCVKITIVVLVYVTTASIKNWYGIVQHDQIKEDVGRRTALIGIAIKIIICISLVIQ